MMKYLFIFSLFLLPVPRFFAGEIREVRLLSDEQVEITFSSQGGLFYDIQFPETCQLILPP